jgi:hypothetical protein
MKRYGPKIALLVLCWLAPAALAERPAIVAVVGADAPKLEKFAAQELAAQFKLLFNAGVEVANTLGDKGSNVILIGSPATNPAIKELVGATWPKLSDQGHLLKSVDAGSRKALVVGGGSPIATLWAVYELGHRFGLRSLLSGDVPPAKTPALKLDGFDVVLEPALQQRSWLVLGPGVIGGETWTLAEQQRLLGQLAKLKFNRVLLRFQAWQPFVDFECAGVQKTSAVLANGQRFSIDGDSGGRAAFRGANELTNTDLAGKSTYQERTAAGIAWARGILKSARDLGMTTAIGVPVFEFPKEFAKVLAGSKPLPGHEGLAIMPEEFDGNGLKQLALAQIRAYLSTYPEVHDVLLPLPEASEKGDFKRQSTALKTLEELLQEPKLFDTASGRINPIVTRLHPAIFSSDEAGTLTLPTGVGLNLGRPSVSQLAQHLDWLDRVPRQSAKVSVALPLANDSVGLLSHMPVVALHAVVGRLVKLGGLGYVVQCGVVGDNEPAAYYLSRASFNPQFTVKQAYEDLITTICDDGVAERMTRAFELMQQASDRLAADAPGLARPGPKMLLDQYADSPALACSKDVSKLYATAMDDMYRAWTRCKTAGRPFILYHAKRLEFSMAYLACVDQLRVAGQARSKKDGEKQVAALEKAIEGLYDGVNALGEMAVDPSDRAVIAVVNEHGLRALRKELEQAEKSAK